MNSTKKIKKRILAIFADTKAIPLNPKNAATIAITRKIMARTNMGNLLLGICHQLAIAGHEVRANKHHLKDRYHQSTRATGRCGQLHEQAMMSNEP